MRISLTLFAALFISFSALGQSSHEEAKSLLKASSDKMKSYKTIKIVFDYNFENTRVNPPVVQNQSGNISLKGNDYHLKLDKLEQIRAGNKVYNILHNDEEVQVTTYEPSEEEQGLTPQKILSSFDKGYSYKLGGTEKLNGETIRYVILKPVGSEAIDKIMVGINDKTKHIYKMQQWGTNGTLTTFMVKDFQVNPTLGADYFKFSEANYPGYYIAR